ncbi:hypothetical protein [Gracilimonas sp.]|uniref:hypothetical protein n=1 Tax=Gracilimonas sp. TaxID=1974203 RepID=UPI0028721E2F|nr:hypothetical protein [Gracilimonas sp.]
MKFTTIIFIIALIFPADLLFSQSNYQKLPAKFEANQIYIETVTMEKDTIKFFTDTGGGGIFITQQLADNLDLKIEKEKAGGRQLMVADIPELQSNYKIPFMHYDFDSAKETVLNRKKDLFANKMLVMPPATGMNKKLQEEGVIDEGMLGQDWFATRIWTIKYGEEELLLHNSFNSDNLRQEHMVDLFFSKDDRNRHKTHLPRIQAYVNGERLNFLLDTGATTFVSNNAHKKMDDNLPPTRGASYITQSKFEKWHEENPNWQVIKKGEKFTGANYIKVPEIRIAGHTVGPVWFTTRPDQVFREHMASMMDKEIIGALGGSVFQFFQMTLHYPEEYAIFHLKE